MRKPKEIIVEFNKQEKTDPKFGPRFDPAIVVRAEWFLKRAGFKLESQEMVNNTGKLVFIPCDDRTDFDPEGLLTPIAAMIYKNNCITITPEYSDNPEKE